MIWEDEQEIIDELLYWQKRALIAEGKLKNEEHLVEIIFEWYEQATIEKEYWKQQFLDKSKEIMELIRMSGDR